MNKFICILLAILLSQAALSNQLVEIKANKDQIFQIDIDSKKYLLVPEENIQQPRSSFGFQPDKNNPIACNGSLLCYRCCTGHSSVSEDFCAYQFKNWMQGTNCACEKLE